MPCSRQPLSTTTALFFSGVSTRLIGKLPRSTASRAGSSRKPVGSGELKTGFVWAKTELHSSAESERTSGQLPSENITGVPHTFKTTNDISLIFRRLSGRSLHILPKSAHWVRPALMPKWGLWGKFGLEDERHHVPKSGKP